MGILVAIGGYDKKESIAETLSINKEIKKLTGKKQPKVLFIPTASEDSDRYIKVFLNHFGKVLGCQTDLLLLYKEKLTPKKIEEKILQADAIYIGGGNTLKMMSRWRRLGVDTMLKKAFRKGIILSGVSAGSICLFDAGVSDSRQYRNPKSHQYIKVTGMGLIPALNCPHYKSKLYDKGHRTKGLKAILKRTGGGVGIAVEDGAAFVMINDRYKVIHSIKGRKVYKVYVKKGEFCEEVVGPKDNLKFLKHFFLFE
jgi:dipeptidase E